VSERSSGRWGRVGSGLWVNTRPTLRGRPGRSDQGRTADPGAAASSYWDEKKLTPTAGWEHEWGRWESGGDDWFGEAPEVDFYDGTALEQGNVAGDLSGFVDRDYHGYEGHGDE